MFGFYNITYKKKMLTIKVIKIQFPIELPVRVVYDGPDPPVGPMPAPYWLMVWP